MRNTSSLLNEDISSSALFLSSLSLRSKQKINYKKKRKGKKNLERSIQEQILTKTIIRANFTDPNLKKVWCFWIDFKKIEEERERKRRSRLRKESCEQRRDAGSLFI